MTAAGTGQARDSDTAGSADLRLTGTQSSAHPPLSSWGFSGHSLSWVPVAVVVLLPLPHLGVSLRDVLRRPASCLEVCLRVVVVWPLVPDAHKLGNAESRGAEHESNHSAKDGDRHDNTALLCVLSCRQPGGALRSLGRTQASCGRAVVAEPDGSASVAGCQRPPGFPAASRLPALAIAGADCR